MTFLHLALVALGVLAAVAASDLLGHRGIGRWPVVVAALALVIAGGWSYSASLSAFALGTAIGACLLFGVERARDLLRTRQTYREATRARSEQTRRLEQSAQGREGL